MPKKQTTELAAQEKTNALAATNKWLSTGLLETRRKELGIPHFSTMPIGDNVNVWRLPPLEMSPGGIIMPEDAQSPNVRGIVVGIGRKARQWAEEEGIQLGSCVIFKRFAGWEHEENLNPHQRTPEHKRFNQILHIKPSDVLDCDDLYMDFISGNARMHKNADGSFVLETKATPEDVAEDKQKRRRDKLRARAADASSPNEAKVAQAILSK